MNLNIFEDGIKAIGETSINSTESSKLQGLVTDSEVMVPSPSTEALILLETMGQKEKIDILHRPV